MENTDDIELLQQLIGHGGEQAFSLVPMALAKVAREQQWKGRKDAHGKKFATFEAFVEHRLWQGLETTMQDLEVFCRKKPELWAQVMAEIEPEREHGTNQHSGHYNIISSKQQGTSALYTLKRLKRDRPDLFQQVLGGEKSPNEAAIEAGFRKKWTAFEQILKLLPKLSKDERDKLKAILND